MRPSQGVKAIDNTTHVPLFSLFPARFFHNTRMLVWPYLRGKDSLQQLREILLAAESEGLSNASKGRLLVVCAAHTASNHDVVALEGLAVLVHDDDHANIVDEDVN